MKTVVKLTIVGVAVAAMALSCAHNRAYVNEEADFGFYTKVGVLPFSNLSADKNGSEKVTSSFVTELLMLNSAQVANMGDLQTVMKNVMEKIPANLSEELTAQDVQKIGLEAGVQGVFVGAVKEYGMVRSGQDQFPLVSVMVRFIDCQVGTVVWSYEVTQSYGVECHEDRSEDTHWADDTGADGRVCIQHGGPQARRPAHTGAAPYRRSAVRKPQWQGKRRRCSHRLLSVSHGRRRPLCHGRAWRDLRCPAP